jgi:hypothetical protein
MARSQSPEPASSRAVTHPAEGTVAERFATLAPLRTPLMQLRADALGALTVVESSWPAEAGAAITTASATASTPTKIRFMRVPCSFCESFK